MPVALVIMLSPLAAWAQAGQSGSGIGALSAPASHLFGDWGGLRKRLHAIGIDLGASYLSETAWNAAGGKRRGIDYAGQEKLSIGVDFGKLVGQHGLSLQIDLVNRNGRNLSTDAVGDSLMQVQEIYGAGGSVLVHLADAYLEQKLFHGTYDVKVGRLPVLTDFGNLPDSCDFMALAICATWGLNSQVGWTAFPNATWGGSLTVNATRRLAVKIGAFEVSPRQGEPSGFYWSLGDAVGVMVPLELDWKTQLGNHRPGIVKVGGYFDSAHQPNWYTAADGVPLPLSTAGPRRSQRPGFYALVQQMLWRTGPQPAEGLTLLAGYIRNDPDTSLFEHFAFIGLLDKGLFPGRPKDRAGLSFVHLRVSSQLTDVQELQSALGMPLSRGAPGIETSESLLEANYNFDLGHGIDVMPDLQWIIHPDATTTYANAIALGLQVKVRF